MREDCIVCDALLYLVSHYFFSYSNDVKFLDKVLLHRTQRVNLPTSEIIIATRP